MSGELEPGNCYFCDNLCATEFYCFDCMNYVCESCDETSPVGAHQVDAHKETEHLDFNI